MADSTPTLKHPNTKLFKPTMMLFVAISVKRSKSLFRSNAVTGLFPFPVVG